MKFWIKNRIKNANLELTLKGVLDTSQCDLTSMGLDQQGSSWLQSEITRCHCVLLAVAIAGSQVIRLECKRLLQMSFYLRSIID